MSDTSRELGAIQRWMQAVIMNREGIAEGLESAEARQHLDVAPEAVETVVTRSRALSAVERLTVYGNAYHARLIECLREEYPIVARTVGEEVFDELAVDYLQKYPSRSYTLNELGRSFPRYLAECAAAEEDSSESWADFLIDLATLEWTYTVIFDGPGFEGQTLLTPEQLLAIEPERWPAARLVVVDCFRLLALRYPVHEYYNAAKNEDEEVAIPEPAETLLAVTRRNYVVRRCPLERLEYEVLRALAEGQLVGDAVALAAQKAGPEDLDGLAEKLRGWFARWAAEGFFRVVEIAG
jgi:hypothetical protein